MIFRRPISIGWMLAALVLALSAPFMVFIGLALAKQASEERERAGQQMLSIAQLTVARLDDHVGDINQILSLLSRIVTTGADDASRNEDLFRSLQERLPAHISNVSVWDIEGRNAGSLDPSPSLHRLDVRDRPFFKRALASNGLVAEAPFVSVSTNEQIGIFAMRIVREGRPIGVVAVSGRLREMQRLVSPNGSAPAGSVITLSDEDGVVLARSIDGEKWVGKTLSRTSAAVDPTALPPEGILDGVVGADGIKRIAGYATASNLPWQVYVGLPEEAAIAPARRHMKQSLAVGTGMLAVGLLLAAWIARGISRPLKQLELQAARIGSGEAGHRIPSRGSAEIKSLAVTLNVMAAALEERTSSLRLSEERLADLYANAPCGYYSLDAEGRFTRVNDTELRWLGRDREAVIGKHVTEFLSDDGRAAFAANFPLMKTLGNVKGVEFDLRSTSGESRRVVLNSTALTD